MAHKAIIIERFSGVSDFIQKVSKRQPNQVFSKAKRVEELSSHTGDMGFTMTRDYAESEVLMSTGYEKGLEDMKQSKRVTVKHASNVHKVIPTAQMVGYAPHVPNAIAGIPQSMIGAQRITQKSKVLTILYDAGASAYVEAERFVKAGRNLLDLILNLELQGYRVQLDIMHAFCRPEQKAFCITNVKSQRQPINPLKVSYLLLHPSFFRRQCFMWLETQPELTETSFSCGYGTPLINEVSNGINVDKVRKWLADNKVMDKGVFYTSFYEIEDITISELMEKMGLKKSK